jgi:hypothetical protein
MIRPAILDRLKGVQKAGKGWLTFCPAHDDQHKRSLSVGLGDDLRTLVHCHARGCTAEQITSAVGMTVADLAPPSGNGHRAPSRQIIATYDYTNASGVLLYQVVRFAPKEFVCRRPDGKGGWTWNLDGVRVVPYRLHELAEASRVFIPEGEKDADALVGLGLIATCNHGGAGKWREDHTSALVTAAVPEVVVLRDNDTSGETHQRSVATSCAACGLGMVKTLDLPDLPPKGDVSDFIAQQRAAGRTNEEIRAELLTRVDAAPVFSPSDATTESAPSTEPTIAAEGDDYRVTWSDAVEFLAVAPRESGEGLHAEVTVTVRGVVVSWGRLNLASTSMREGLVKKLDQAAAVIPWRERLEWACRLIAERIRAGSPVIEIRPAPRPAADRDVIEDVLPVGETGIIYGDGDSGKGWLALTAALSLITGRSFPHLRPTRGGQRVLYLDYEAAEAEIAARLDALCRGAGITFPAGMFLYREMFRALADEAARIRADVARHQVNFVVVDSMVPAAGSDPEGADATIRTLNALRSLTGTSRLVIAHVNRLDADKTSGTARPWGSVFVRNLARATWEIRRSEPDGDDLVLGAYLTKRNDGKRGMPPWGLRFRFAEDGAVTVHDHPLARTPDLLAKATTWQQIYAALANGPKTAEAVALELDLKAETVRKTLERRRGMGHVVNPQADGPLKWALVTHRGGA